MSAGVNSLRVVAYELDGSVQPPQALPLIGVTAELDTTVVVGRNGDLPLGVFLDDPGISRRAVMATATVDGWHLEFNNRNGAWVQPWAQPARWRQPGSQVNVMWPRVAVRVAGSDRDRYHWVLLESDVYPLPSPGDTPFATRSTVMPARPEPLTAKQLDAVWLFFAAHLAWPPVSAPTTTPLKSVARQLGVGESTVQDRLSGVVDRAQALGLQGDFAATSVDCFMHIAAHGYVTPAPAELEGVTYR